MSKQGRRAHVKRAKHLAGRWKRIAGSRATGISRDWPRSWWLPKNARKLINRAHAIRGGYQS